MSPCRIRRWKAGDTTAHRLAFAHGLFLARVRSWFGPGAWTESPGTGDGGDADGLTAKGVRRTKSADSCVLGLLPSDIFTADRHLLWPDKPGTTVAWRTRRTSRQVRDHRRICRTGHRFNLPSIIVMSHGLSTWQEVLVRFNRSAN